MKKVLQVALICVLFATANNTKALTVSASVRWHGGWCSLCGFNTYGDEYACAYNPWYNYYPGDTDAIAWNCSNCSGWFAGKKPFIDPLPSGATITGCTVSVCEADCGDTYVGVAINGWTMGTYYPTGNCYCGGTYTFSLTNNSVAGLIAAYHFQGIDTLTLSPNTTVCISEATVTFTYVLGANLNTLPAQSLANNPWCPGDSIMVPYYAAGSYNNLNVFTAELSNSSGNFSTYTTLGTLTSTTSGTIHGFIPSNTPLGTGYSIRVIASSPSTIGADTVENITISSSVATITSTANTICSGHSLILTASTGQHYTWYRNDTAILTNVTTNPWIVTPSANTTRYSVYVSNSSGCQGTSTHDTITLAPLPSTPTNIYGPGSICNFSQANYSTPSCTNATSYYWTINPSYIQSEQWTHPNDNLGGYQGDTIIGQGSQTISVAFGDLSSATLTVYAVDSCGNSTGSASLSISVLTGQQPGTWIGGNSNNWFNALNWCGGVPTSTTDAFIEGDLGIINGYYEYMPVINQDSSATAAVCRNLWLFGDGDSLTIADGNNCFQCGSLSIYGDFWNGGYGFNPGNSATFIPNHSIVYFEGSGGYQSWVDYTSTPAGNNSTYSSGGNSIFGYCNTPFYNLTINKGSDNTTVLENIAGNGYGQEDIISVANNLELLNGTFLLSQDSSTVRSSGAFTIPSTAALDLNGGWLLRGNYSITNNGQFILDYYSYPDTIGTSSGNSITNNGPSSSLLILNNKLSVASQVIVSGGATLTIDDNNPINSSPVPSELILNTSATSSNTNAVLDIDASSNLEYNNTNGTCNIVFEKANSGTLAPSGSGGNDLRIYNGTGTKTISGPFQFGDANTPTNTTFCVKDSLSSTTPFDIININSYNNPTVRLDAATTISNNLNLTTGVLNLNHNLLTIGSNASSAISTNTISPYGYILAEDTNNYAAVNWTVLHGGTNVNTFPFGNSSGVYIPVVVKNNSATTDINLQIATYAPPHNGHMPYPPTVSQIRDSTSGHVNDSANMVNRFWQIDAPLVSTANNIDVTFHYSYNERPANGDTSTGPNSPMKAQRYVASNTGWMSPYAVYAPGGSQASQPSLVSNAITGGYVKVSKMNHCSPWALTKSGLNPQPLPIELLKFTAAYDGKNVDLNWTTSSELNNDYFTISKTKDQSEYSFVAEVAGAGNSDQLLNYSAVDNSPFQGLSFYQLTQTDYNGNSTKSDLVPIMIGDNSFSILNIYNDNTKGTMNIFINDNNAENITATLYDVMGRQVNNVSMTTVKGTNQIEFNSENLPKGIYLISISNNNQSLSGKIAN